MISKIQQDLIIKISSKFNPKLIGVFGSYARNENSISSDLDLLIDFEEDINLLDIIGLEQDLSEALEIKVDLITVNSLNPQLKIYIEPDLILLPLPVTILK